jgi:dTDP-4-amino-4,6-dideoxygalactose transaminase
MSDIQSAIGIHQLRKLERFAARRLELVELYKAELANVSQLELPEDCTDGRHSWHLFIARLNLDKLTIDRGEFIEELNRLGVGTSVHFIPIPLHPYFARWANLSCNRCPRALALYERIFSLPLYPSLTNNQIKEIADRVKIVVEHHTKTPRRWRSPKRFVAAAR